MRSKRRKHAKHQRAFGLVVLLIAVFLILTSGSPLLSKPAVEAQLAAFSDTIADYAKRRDGSEASFTHGGITTHGWGTGQYALVDKPLLTFKQASDASQTVTIATDALQISAPGDGTNHIVISFPGAISVSVNNQPSTVFQFDAAPQYHIVRAFKDNAPQIEQTLKLPPHFTVQALGGSDQEVAQVFNITYAADPLIRALLTPAQQRRETELSLQDLQISGGASDMTLHAATVHSLFTRTKQPDNTENFSTELTVNDLNAKSASGENGPFSLKLNATAVSKAPAPPATTAAAAPDVDYKINELTVSHDNFRVNATGTLSVKPDDDMPFGALDIGVQDLPSLRTGPLLPEPTRIFVLQALDKISGQDLSTASDIHFSVTREKQGELHIGQATVSDLLTLYAAQAPATGSTDTPPLAPPASGQPEPGDSVPADEPAGDAPQQE